MIISFPCGHNHFILPIKAGHLMFVLSLTIDSALSKELLPNMLIYKSMYFILIQSLQKTESLQRERESLYKNIYFKHTDLCCTNLLILPSKSTRIFIKGHAKCISAKLRDMG